MLGKKIKLKYIYSFFRCFLIKLKYGSKIKINPFKVYISPLSSIEISGDAHVIVRDDFDRVYISKNTKINCSGGVLVIGNGVFFNENSQLVCHESINIGDNCLFGPNICIYDSDHKFSNSEELIRLQGYTKEKISIDKDVWVGAGSVITKGTEIGSHTVIGANSVVRGKLESNCVYAGNPIKKIRNIS